MPSRALITLTKSFPALPKGTVKQLCLQWTTSAYMASRDFAKAEPLSFPHVNIGVLMGAYSGSSE